MAARNTAPVQVLKTFTAKVDASAKDGDAPGTIRALVSAFGVEDSAGDIVEAGAFTKTIHEWALKEGRAIPLVWSHQFRDVDNILGEITEMTETEKGLEIVATFDLDQPRAKRVYELMQRGLIAEFSWSGLVREYELIEDDDAWWPSMKILDVDFWEAGPCFKGANPDTELLSIKADGTIGGLLREKAGRVLSQPNYDALKSAYEAIGEVLAKAEPVEDEDDEDTSDEAEPAEPEQTTEDAAKSATPDINVRALLELTASTL